MGQVRDMDIFGHEYHILDARPFFIRAIIMTLHKELKSYPLLAVSFPAELVDVSRVSYLKVKCQ